MTEKLWNTLQRACENVPYYRDFRGLDLERFPIVSKSEFRKHYPKFLSQRLAPEIRNQLETAAVREASQLPDPRHREISIGKYYLERSSGTTGPCFWHAKSTAERTMLSLSALAARQRFSRGKLRRGFLDLNHYFSAPERYSAPITPDTLARAYSEIRDAGCSHLYAFASLALAHAQILQGTKERMDFDVFEVAGEYLTKEQTALIGDVFHCPVLNQYGTRESWVIGYAEGASESFDLAPSVYVEICDSCGISINQDELVGEIIVSSLICEAFPIIRFRTGDTGCWVTEGGVKRLRLEADRQSSLLHTKSGAVVSGNRYFKRIIESAFDENRQQILNDWKIRKRGNQICVYLRKEDTHVSHHLLQLLEARQEELGSLQFTIQPWEGWKPGEKRIPFVNLEETPQGV